jgi:hypothetical protein
VTVWWRYMFVVANNTGSAIYHCDAVGPVCVSTFAKEKLYANHHDERRR